MYAIQSQHLLSDLIGADAAAKLGNDRLIALRKSFAVAVGAVAIVLTASCQQFNGKTSTAPMVQPGAVVQAATDVHDSSWISQAHALAAKNGADGAVSDLSY